jgi:hypothetical protein
MTGMTPASIDIEPAPDCYATENSVLSIGSACSLGLTALKYSEDVTEDLPVGATCILLAAGGASTLTLVIDLGQLEVHANSRRGSAATVAQGASADCPRRARFSWRRGQDSSSPAQRRRTERGSSRRSISCSA